MNRIVCFFALSLLSSCQTYQSCFDYCPQTGLPCKSVSEIEAMIVETEKGPDVLVERDTREKLVFKECETKRNKGKIRRIWVNEQKSKSGTDILGHHIYFREEG